MFNRKLFGAVGVGLIMVISACGAGERSTTTTASSAVEQDGVAKAKALIEEAKQRPTELPNTTPIGQAVPAGKTVDFVGCPAVECNQFGDLLTDAAEQLGWTLRIIPTDGTPGSQQQAFQQIVRDKPDGAIYVGTDRSVYERFLPEIETNGTWMVSVCSTDTEGNGIDFVVCTPDQQRSTGQLLAASVVADSEGTANAVYVNVPAFTNLSKLQEQFLSDTQSMCPTCATSTLDIPITSLGNDAPQRIIGYLKSHPEVGYVVVAIDSLALGLPAALKAAGLDDVEVVGQGGGDATTQAITTGDQLASVPWPYVETYLTAFDSIVRHVAGVDQIPSELPRFWFLDTSNVDQTEEKVDGMIPVVLGAQNKFYELWQGGPAA